MSEVCKSCGAAILWALTRKGKRIPLDATPNPKGNLTLTGGSATIAEDADLFTASDAVRYVSHFVTCPDAATHRKAKR
jgi:hypothetical protein